MTQGDSMDSWGCSPRSPSRGAVKTILPHCSGRLRTHLTLFYTSLPRKALDKVLVNLSQQSASFRDSPHPAGLLLPCIQEPASRPLPAQPGCRGSRTTRADPFPHSIAHTP